MMMIVMMWQCEGSPGRPFYERDRIVDVCLSKGGGIKRERVRKRE